MKRFVAIFIVLMISLCGCHRVVPISSEPSSGIPPKVNSSDNGEKVDPTSTDITPDTSDSESSKIPPNSEPSSSEVPSAPDPVVSEKPAEERPTQSAPTVDYVTGDGSVPENDAPAEPLPELAGDNIYRPDYNLGTCKKLSGDVAVVVIYMNDFEQSWSEDAMNTFTEKAIKPGLAFLKKEATQYNIDLRFKITDIYASVWYDDDVITDCASTGLATIDVAYQAANELGYASDTELCETILARENVDEVILLTVFNKNGTSYALNPKRGSDINIEEHCIIFARDLNTQEDEYFPASFQSSVVAHEILHLYGAEDYYSTPERKALASKYYPEDIMLSAKYFLTLNKLGEVTAFYIGWTDIAPDIIKTPEWGI